MDETRQELSLMSLARLACDRHGHLWSRRVGKRGRRCERCFVFERPVNRKKSAKIGDNSDPR